MTVQKVKDWLIALEESEEINEFYYADNFKDALKIAVKNIAELEQYRTLGTVEEIIKHRDNLEQENHEYSCLGTVEELKEAREKQIPKKPIEDKTAYSGYKCSACGSNVYLLRSHNINKTPHCIFCGQALKWGEEDD